MEWSAKCSASASSRFLGVAAACVLAACGDGTVAQGDLSNDPAGAVFVTTDIEHFWEAYEAGGKNNNSTPFQTLYLDRASPGLQAFIASRNVTASSLRLMVSGAPNYFAAIKDNMLRLATETEILETIRANYEAMEALYPQAVYPPVTFLVGRFSTGGTVQQGGMLIGTEFYSIDENTPLGELTAFARTNVKPLDSIPLIVAHEHVHVLQAHARQLITKQNKTLLDQSLLEGSADFLGELVSGSHINKHIHVYGLANEHQLWVEFQGAMNGLAVSEWLYNQGTATGERPGDLGYFMGYRIAKAYYDKATDRTAAVREIIEMNDGAAFLAASGYNP